MLDTRLLEILACPLDKGSLLYFAHEGFLYNPRLNKQYRIHDGIPVMLPDEAADVTPSEHELLMARATLEGIKPTFGV